MHMSLNQCILPTLKVLRIETLVGHVMCLKGLIAAIRVQEF